MKIKLNPQELEKLNPYFDASDLSIISSGYFNGYLEEVDSWISEGEIRDKIKEGYAEKAAISSLLIDHIEFEEEGIDAFLREFCKFPYLSKMNFEEFKKNPYLTDIKFPESSKGNIKLSHNYYDPYELFVSGETLPTGKDLAEVTPIAYFDRRVDYPVILNKNQVWMSVTPHEINTMRESIENAKGDVVTFGLGLGYYAYMVSLKKEVKSVTVIEKDERVIDLFNRHILPQFKNRDKIRIIHADAFSYIEKKANDKDYDHAFIDIYHTAEDALPLYARFKRSEKNWKNTEFSYWIEETILCFLRRFVVTLAIENGMSYTRKDYETMEEEERKLFLSLYDALENIEISSIEDFEKMISDENLRELVKKI